MTFRFAAVAAAVGAAAAFFACSAPDHPAPSAPTAPRGEAQPATSPSPALQPSAARPAPPIPGAEPADELIHPEERHFRHLWRLTRGGENAEAYWSTAGDRLVLQRRNVDERILCDRIYVTHPTTGALEQVSDGRGATTCAYFLPGDRSVIFASTGGVHEGCPPPPDMSQGYVWALHPEYELYVKDLTSGETRRLTNTWGYDAEATVSPLGDRIVFTSTRTGDLELWTCNLEGGDLRQVTNSPGYDGGAFFSHDGKRLVFRATSWTPGREEEERADYLRLLGDWRVRPTNMEIFVCDADGSNRRQVTRLGQGNWAPYFTPDDRRILFASNHHVHARSRNFDLFLIGVDGDGLEQVTHFDGFDSFPMFSPDGKWLAFASNRGGTLPGETNVFIALWQE